MLFILTKYCHDNVFFEFGQSRVAVLAVSKHLSSLSFTLILHFGNPETFQMMITSAIVLTWASGNSYWTKIPNLNKIRQSTIHGWVILRGKFMSLELGLSELGGPIYQRTIIQYNTTSRSAQLTLNFDICHIPLCFAPGLFLLTVCDKYRNLG